MKIENSQLLPNATQVSTILSRVATNSNSPEAKLILAVIGQALVDAMWNDDYRYSGKISKAQKESYKKLKLNRESGRAFFREGNYRQYCDLVGLNPDWVANFLMQYAMLECRTNGLVKVAK